MAKRTPPLLTPFAIMSIVLALGATNVAVNGLRIRQKGVRAFQRSQVHLPASKASHNRRKADMSRIEEMKVLLRQNSKALPKARRRKARFQTRKAQVQRRKKKAQAPRLHQAAARARLRQAHLRQTTKTMKGVNKRCSAFLE